MRSFFLVSVLFIFLAGSGCMNRVEKASENMIAPIRFLALGDSYTIGEGVETHAAWPEVLRDTLQQLGVSLPAPQIVAKTGWTTDELLAAIVKENLEPPYDFVSLLIGVNNQYRGTSRGYQLDDYNEDFSILLNKAIELANGNPGRVLVISIPDYSVTPFVSVENKARVAHEIGTYNQVKKLLSDSAGVLYVDITPISQMAANNQSLLASDNLHPSEMMYKKWVAEMLPLVLNRLNQ